MLFARKDLKDLLEKAAEITKKPKADFEESQRIAAENLAKAGLAPAPAPAAKAEASESSQEPIDIPAKEEITYEQFGAMQFQVGEIIKCEAVEKSKKLLCSQVKIGSQVKQIVSGIRKYYTPEEMVGKKVMVLVNLKPAVLAGVKSEGMLLCAEDADGNLSLMTSEKPMPSGAEVC
jgi:methionyl-tRNA synthetase